MLDDTAHPASPVLGEILAGLGASTKTLPAKLFYDEEGCRLFGQITTLPEYYVTRTELALLPTVARELPALPGGALVEYGGSDETKAMMLADAVGFASYVPIDVASEALDAIAARLRAARPGLAVHPVVADFLQPFALPPAIGGQAKLGFFPGSTVGNLHPAAAGAFLKEARRTLGRGSRFLVGVDLRKDPARLEAAYDDAQGVTAAFNRNLLRHVNRIAPAAFDPHSFEHQAVWNEESSRIEMHLRSMREQTVMVGGQPIHFRAGESIHTENSYKYTVGGFRAVAEDAGWTAEAVWTDGEGLFSIHLLAGGEPE